MTPQEAYERSRPLAAANQRLRQVERHAATTLLAASWVQSIGRDPNPDRMCDVAARVREARADVADARRWMEAA